jgi:hypothetical protein
MVARNDGCERSAVLDLRQSSSRWTVLMGRDRHSVALGVGVILSVLNLLVCIHMIKRLHCQMRRVEQASRPLASP